MILFWCYILSQAAIGFVGLQVFRACRILIKKNEELNYEISHLIEKGMRMQSEVIKKDLEQFKKLIAHYQIKEIPKKEVSKKEIAKPTSSKVSDEQRRKASERKRKWWANQRRKKAALAASQSKQPPPEMTFLDVSDKPT